MTFDERAMAASSNATHPSMLAKLAMDEAQFVRWCVARNENTPAQVLELLAQDENNGVRCGVIDNPSTPREIKFLLILEFYERKL